MYSTTWCGYCRRLKDQMEREGIAYTEVDIEHDPGAAEFVMSVNGGNQTVPTLLFPDGSALPTPRSRRCATASPDPSARCVECGNGRPGDHFRQLAAGSARGISGESSGPPYQCSMIRREIEMPPDTTTDPSASAAASSSRVNHRAASISSGRSRSSVPSARGREAEHQGRRERPGLVAEVGHLADLDADLLGHLAATAASSDSPGSTNPASVENRPRKPLPRASRMRSSSSTTAMITAGSVRG